MKARTAAVITCSTRAAAGDYEDTTGPRIATTLTSWGFQVLDVMVVPDGDPVGLALTQACEAGADLIITTGGTGLSPTDVTPEQTRAILVFEVPGIAEELRAVGVRAGVPAAVLSRGVAGVALSRTDSGRSLVVNLPGSSGGVKDGLKVLEGIVFHALDQLAGSDHQRQETA